MESLNQINEIAKSISGFLIPLIAVITAYIAYQQYKINQNKLKFDLYDKRFKVYYSLMGLISYVIQAGTTTKEETDKFMREIYESKFLFHENVSNYLNIIHNRAKELRYLDKKIANARTTDEREKLLNEKDKHFDWFVDQMKESQKIFSSYLTIPS